MIVQVNFKEHGDTEFNAGPYSFIFEGDKISVGDLVLVDTRYGINLAQVTRIAKYMTQNAYITSGKKIIQVLDIGNYLKDKEKEKAKQLKELEKQMEEIFTKNMVSIKYAQMATVCPAIQKLYEQYRQIKGGSK